MGRFCFHKYLTPTELIHYLFSLRRSDMFVENGIKKYEEQMLIQKQRSLSRLAKELKAQVVYNV